MDSETKTVINLLDSNYSKKLMSAEGGLHVAKSSSLADQERKEGNMIFRCSDIELHERISTAWNLYSLSIAAAEPNTEALAMAYGNRSAVLVHLLKYEESMADIDKAVEITTNDHLKIKLLCRKVKCLIALGYQEEGENVISKVQELLERIEDLAIKKSLEDLIKKMKLELKMPSNIKPKLEDKKTRMLENLFRKHDVNDFSAVDIQYNEKFGRHLVATRDIRVGEIIFIEKPYTRCLSVKTLHPYCYHCFTTTWANIPCNNCSCTMFCSEKCKKEAWEEYHDIECPVYACSNKDFAGPLAIKTMILGIKEAGGIENLKAELEAFDESNDFKKGFVKDGVIQPDGFKSIYALSKEISEDRQYERRESTAWVLRALGRNTSFFGENFNSQDSISYKSNENAVFLGSLFLRLSKISELNHREMWNGDCKNNLNWTGCWTSNCCTRGVYIAPITSLLNHSCDPNARRLYTNNHHVIIHATQTIKKGDQIFDCYQQEFYAVDIFYRRKFLERCYNFSCDCIACLRELSNYGKMLDISYRNRLGTEELMVAQDYKNLIPSRLNSNETYDEESIALLVRVIERSYTLPQPAVKTLSMTKMMILIFKKLYGISLHTPEECHSA